MIPKKISFKEKFFLIVFGLFLTVLLLEIFLRLCGFIVLSFQEHRNQESLRQKGSYRILCMGDSMTALGEENSYPRQLENILNSKNLGRHFSVVNKGIAGSNSALVVQQLPDYLREYNPGMVIVMIGINDEWQPITYEDFSEKRVELFLKSLRVYKLARFLKEHIVHRFREIMIAAGWLGIKEDEQAIAVGQLYTYQREFQKAEEQFQKAIKFNPSNDDAYLNLGVVYNRRHMPQAESSFKKAIELNPKNFEAYNHLGVYYTEQKEFKKSEAAFKKAIEINPQYAWSYYGLMWCYDRQGEYRESRKIAEEALRKNLQYEWLYASMVTYCKIEGDQQGVDTYTQKARNFGLHHYNPVLFHNYTQLSELVLSQGKKLVCVSYPTRSVIPLRELLKSEGPIIFTDNEESFRRAVEKEGFGEYFIDIFAGDFGHCTPKGNRLLANNVAETILKEKF